MLKKGVTISQILQLEPQSNLALTSLLYNSLNLSFKFVETLDYGYAEMRRPSDKQNIVFQ